MGKPITVNLDGVSKTFTMLSKEEADLFCEGGVGINFSVLNPIGFFFFTSGTGEDEKEHHMIDFYRGNARNARAQITGEDSEEVPDFEDEATAVFTTDDTAYLDLVLMWARSQEVAENQPECHKNFPLDYLNEWLVNLVYESLVIGANEHVTSDFL